MYLIPQDKANHITVGAAIACAVLCFAPPLIALAVVAVAGGLKELYDRRHPNHTPDVLDFVATLAGGALVVIPAFVG